MFVVQRGGEYGITDKSKAATRPAPCMDRSQPTPDANAMRQVHLQHCANCHAQGWHVDSISRGVAAPTRNKVCNDCQVIASM
jgi:hypothetical protein